MMAYYPMLIEFCIEFKRCSRKYIADYKKEVYNESMSARNVAMADGYALKYDPECDMVYCLQNNQTIQERVTQIKSLELKPAQISNNKELS